MEENENGFLPPEKIKAEIGIMLTQKHGNYVAALAALDNLYIGEDNIQQVQQTLRNINAYLKDIDEHRKEAKEPFLTQGRVIDKEHNDFAAPIISRRDLVQARVNTFAKAMADRAAKERADRERRAATTTQINNFILDNSVKIASATTNEQLFYFEKLINLEKGKKTVYGDQLPLLIERCNELTDKIKEQKELVKQKEALEKAKKEAEKQKNDEKLEELMIREAALDNLIQDKTIQVQEMASNSMIVQEDVIEAISAPKARRTTWKAEISDVNIAIKKAKEMLIIELDPEKVRNSINTLKSAGVFTGKEEVTVNGIRYYLSQTF